MSLQFLPSELYLAILSQVPTPHLQSTTLSLSRAIPRSPVPLRSLFQDVKITRRAQLPQLYRRLKFDSKDSVMECGWVKSFTLLHWDVDADVLVNTVVLFTSLVSLNLRVGTVFAPEHLEELFRRPFSSLSLLNIRFRPYVKTATYYQFLKGSYFDSVFDCISNWESSGLKYVSITQDPLPVPGENEKAFAQPIVFFSFAPLTILSTSFPMRNVAYLRLNIPSRRLVQYFTGFGSSSIFDFQPFPNLVSLDLSSCAVHAADLPILINCIGKSQLKHVILDNTNICNGSAGEWEALGKAIVLADITPTRQREKLLKTWSESPPPLNTRDESSSQRYEDIAHPRRGRRGLATATISLRERSKGNAIRRPDFMSSESIRQLGKFRIVPTIPQLQSLCINRLTKDMEATAMSDFAKGWSDGCHQLQATWTRLQQSQSNGVRLFRFDPPREWESYLEFAGFAEIGRPGEDDFWNHLTSKPTAPPSLCFAGAVENVLETGGEHEFEHPDECGHRASNDVWPSGV